MASTDATTETSHIISNLDLGAASGAGVDLKVYGDTDGQYFMWDASADTAYLTGTVDIDGTVTVGVNDTGYDVKFFGATSGSYVLWDEDADKLEFRNCALRMGTLSSTDETAGIKVDATRTRVMEVHASDADTARAVGTQNRAIFGRTMIFANNACEDWGVDGLSKISAVAKTGNVSAGVVGRFESTGTCSTATGSGNCFVAGVMGRLGLAANFTIGAGTFACGVLSFYNTASASDPSGEYTCAFMATASDIAGTGDWDYGLYLEDVTTGIYLPGNFATNAIYIRNTQATTALPTIDSQSIFSATSGYHIGAQFYGDLTGVGTGSVYALRGHADNSATQTDQSTAQYIIGVHGRVINSGTCNDENTILAGVLGQVLNGGTYTEVSMLNAIWADWQNTATVSSGTKNMVYITNNANQVVDNAFYIKAGTGSGTISNLFSLNTLGVNDGMVRYQNVYTTHGGTYRNIRILINDTAYWLIVSDTPTS